jgi:acyl-CoA thioesterase
MIDRKKEPVRYAVEVVGADPFAKLLGIEIEEARDGYARARVSITEELCNCHGVTHGGLLFALADQAFAVAANTLGYDGFAIEIKINYFRTTRPGETVFAEATPIDIRKRVSLWNIKVTDAAGEQVALAHGIAYHFG